jgi:hypothetical protein
MVISHISNPITLFLPWTERIRFQTLPPIKNLYLIFDF